MTGKTSNIAALMHVLKGNIGTGILSLPIAFSYAGIALGSIGIPIIGGVAVYCMHLLILSQAHLCTKLSLTDISYEAVAEKAFTVGPKKYQKYGTLAGQLVFFNLFVSQIGICSAYLLFVIENLKMIICEYIPSAENFSIYFYFILIYPIMVSLNLIKSLRYLAIASTVANILQIGGILLIFNDLRQNLPSINSRNLISDFEGWPIYFSTVIFAFEGIAIILPIYKSLKAPHSFQGLFGTLNQGMAIVMALYLIVGLFGYLKYGDEVHDSITLNLPPGILWDINRLMFTIAVFLSYPLQLYVPLHLLQPWIQSKINTKKNDVFLLDTIFRASMVGITFCFAALVPHLYLVISLVGAFSSTCLTLVLPPIIHIVTFWEEMEKLSSAKRSFIIIKNILITCIGLIAFVTGTYTSIAEILRVSRE